MNESVIDLLTKAITEVAHSPESMRKLARAASTRTNCEREWVYEIDCSQALSPDRSLREVSLGNRQHADMRIGDTAIEFKSTKPQYANPDTMWNATSRIKASHEAWLSPDMDRMADRHGIFVLLISTAGTIGVAQPDRATLEAMRDKGVALDLEFLEKRSRQPVTVSRISAGVGTYHDRVVLHDALIADWSQGASADS